MQHGTWERVPIDAQSVEAPLSRSAVFLVMAVGDDGDLEPIRDLLGAVGDLVKNVAFRDLGGTGTHRAVDTRRPALPPPSRARRHDVRARAPAARSHAVRAPRRRRVGTYFIGYAGRLWVIERMLERMFIGVPPRAYDRLLDFSTAVTGTTFFVPTAAMLEELAQPSTPGPLTP